DDRAARLWNARTGELMLEPLRHGDGPYKFRFLREADFSPDGSLLATAAKDHGKVRVWNCRTGEVTYNLEHGGSDVFDVRFSPDGGRLAATFTNAAVIWNLASNPPHALSLPHQGPVSNVEFSPDGGRVVTASSGGAAQVWDALSG